MASPLPQEENSLFCKKSVASSNLISVFLDFLSENGIDYFRCDIMDGHFVPNLMLSTEIVKAVRRSYSVLLDYHFMVENPETMLPRFPVGEGDIVSVHCESTVHVCRVLDEIRKTGATPALALNPSTPLSFLEETAGMIGMLLIMTVNPGFAAQKMAPNSLAKITRFRRWLDEHGYESVSVEVNGNCNYEHIPQIEEAGANIFVTGSSSIISERLGIEKGFRKTIGCLKNYR